MALSHVTLFFVQGAQGWVEQLYRSDASFAESVAAALKLAVARYSILGAGALLTRVRVSQLGAPGNSVSRHVSASQPSTPAVPASTAALIQLAGQGDRPYTRPYWLHGLPVGAWQQIGGNVQLAAPWAGPIAAWMQMLVNAGWLIQGTVQLGQTLPVQSIVPTQFPAEPEPITARAQWTPNSPVVGLVAYLLDAPTIKPATVESFTDAVVRIARAKWFPPLPQRGPQVNGQHPLFAVQGSVVAAQVQAVPPGGYVSGGTVTLTQRGWLPILGWTFIRVGVHAVGRAKPSNGPAGSTPAPLTGLPSFVQIPSRPLIPGQAAALAALAPYSPPAGTVPTPPPPVIPAPPPPPPPGPFEPISMDPRPVTLTTLADVGVWIRQYCGFYGFPQFNPIAIGKCTNLVNTWVVMLYGQKLEVLGTDPNILTSIAAGIGATNDYLRAVDAAAQAVIPPGQSVLLYGYSLGGMICELFWAHRQDHWDFLNIVTLGSPVTCLSNFKQPITRFAIFDDPVPLMTPLGLFATVTLLGGVLYSIVRSNPDVHGALQQHIQMCTNPFLARWNAWGQPIGGVGPPLELDALRMFPTT